MWGSVGFDSMAAGAEVTGEVWSSQDTDTVNGDGIDSNAESVSNGEKDSDSKSEFKMQDIVDMLSKLKLNPLAKEFFPSYLYDPNRDQLAANNISPSYKNLGNDNSRRVYTCISWFFIDFYHFFCLIMSQFCIWLMGFPYLVVLDKMFLPI